jgi:polyisoprenoid-binding protein YceI
MLRAKGTIHVFTFKEGVLSAVAHDLRIRVERFDVTLDGEQVRAEIDLKSLFVDGPMEGGVLHTDQHPNALFTGTATPTADGYDVAGKLQLAGNEQPLSFTVRNDAGTYRAQFEIQPSRWRISQYKALLGAIKLKDVVRVELALSEA